VKNTLILLAALACVILSCSKTTTSGNYHLTAIIDGQTQSFNASLQAFHVGSLAMSIQGKTSANNTYPNLQLALLAPDSPAIGTFGNSNNPQVTLTAILELSDTAHYIGSGLSTTTLPNPITLTITSSDANSVQGTFSGDFYNANTTNSKKAVTGDFDVPWKK
jgi:hypothetical protein